MNPVELQFSILKQYMSEAKLQPLPDGTYLISVPNIQLNPGWSKSNTHVHFIAPVGYPLARPDCFWTDSDLRLANGALPQNTAINSIPHTVGNFVWFSWHLGSWNANNDNLLTYLYVIKARLHDIR